MGWAGHRMLARKVELILKGPVRILPGESEDAGEGVIPDRGTGTGKGTKVLGSMGLLEISRATLVAQSGKSLPAIELPFDQAILFLGIYRRKNQHRKKISESPCLLKHYL